MSRGVGIVPAAHRFLGTTQIECVASMNAVRAGASVSLMDGVSMFG